MRDLLESLFGETGALVAQLVITVVVVLVLSAAVYWLVRRLSGMRIGGIGRGRVPRLAIVDAMAVDNRRRLVLVRRDNVEHLIMIGGPSDLVVEPSIVRTRPRAPQQPVRHGQQPSAVAQPTSPASASPAPPPPPVRSPDSAAGYPPVLVPPARGLPPDAPLQEPTAHPFQRASRAAPAGADAKRAAPAEPGEASQLTAVAPARAEAGGPSAPPDPETVRPDGDAVATADHERPGSAETGQAPDDSDRPALGLASETVPQAAAVAGAATPSMDDPNDGDDRVSDLEQDMARLLGEINAKRSSV